MTTSITYNLNDHLSTDDDIPETAEEWQALIDDITCEDPFAREEDRIHDLLSPWSRGDRQCYQPESVDLQYIDLHSPHHGTLVYYFVTNTYNGCSGADHVHEHEVEVTFSLDPTTRILTLTALLPEEPLAPSEEF